MTMTHSTRMELGTEDDRPRTLTPYQWSAMEKPDYGAALSLVHLPISGVFFPSGRNGVHHRPMMSIISPLPRGRDSNRISSRTCRRSSIWLERAHACRLRNLACFWTLARWVRGRTVANRHHRSRTPMRPEESMLTLHHPV